MLALVFIREYARVFHLLLIAALLFIPMIPLGSTALPANFVDWTFVSGLTAPTAMDFSPDGRLFVTEMGGKLRVIKNSALLSNPFVSLSVNSAGERGLLGIAFDPDFDSNGYVYVYYTTSSTPIHNRVSRLTADPANPDRALAGSELQILNLETLSAINHNGGAIHFGKDGKLYVATGDNGNSANSQSLSTRLGKILRINPDGTIPTDNPFYNTVGAKKEIWALGLRNPFTFAFSPVSGSTLMYINDVGQDSREEIDSGARGANYGWPTCEGSCSNSGFVNPVYSYAHNGAGKSIAGGAFYESSQFPAEYKGSYFYGDYVAGFIKRLKPDMTSVDFLTGINSPVDIKVGPDGSLYYLSIGAGQVRKVHYTASSSNNPPNAVAAAIPTSGPAPLSVTFDGSGSSDPDAGNVLVYSWNFGDGTPAASGVSVTHTYSAAGMYAATLTLTDGRGGTDSATINIAAGSPPVGTINTPASGTRYNAGDTISFSGSGTDGEDGTLPTSAFDWKILFHHNTHTHPFMEFGGIKSGSFTVPRTGETSDDVWYRIYLAVTDSSGLTHQSTRDVLPNKATITLASNLAGLQINLDGQPRATPYSFVGVVGVTRTLQASSPQTVNGDSYQFESWSDGGAATHTINTPSGTTTYTANYVVAPSTSSILTIKSQDTNGNTITGYWTALYNSGGNMVDSDFTPATFTLNHDQQYYIHVGNYGDIVFDYWLDNRSTTDPRSISITSNTQLTAVYRNSDAPPPDPSYPIIHMSDTSTSWGSLIYSGREINAEYVTASSQLEGDRIDSITIRLQKSGSPTGAVQVGVFNADLSVKKLFGTIDASAVSASYQNYEFKLSGSELYTIQDGDRIGVKYTGGSGTNGILVMIDRYSGDPFDGTNSHRIRYESRWLYYDTNEDMYMILKQTIFS